MSHMPLHLRRSSGRCRRVPEDMRQSGERGSPARCVAVCFGEIVLVRRVCDLSVLTGEGDERE